MPDVAPSNLKLKNSETDQPKIANFPLQEEAGTLTPPRVVTARHPNGDNATFWNAM
jgi:hypothetical protein